MANPIGTTARQLAGLARWTLAVLLIVAMLAWWWPSLRSWASLSGGLGVVLLLWTMRHIVRGDRSVPGHPIYLALIGPLLILGGHLVIGLASGPPAGQHALAGGMLSSLIALLSLIALGVMLSQSLLVGIRDAPRFHAVLALAMMVGADTALIVPGSGPVRPAMTLLGIAGVLVWLAPLWPFRSPDAPEEHSEADVDEPTVMFVPPWLTHISWIGWGGVVVGQLVVLTFAEPLVVLVAGCLVGGVFLLSGFLLKHRRWGFLLTGAILLAGGGLGLHRVAPGALDAAAINAGILGKGEAILGKVSASGAGWLVLGGLIGWGGLLWLLGGAVMCIALMLVAVRREAPDRQVGAVLWTAATAVGTSALLERGGLVIPAVIVVVSMLWGSLPGIADRKRRRRSGWWVLVWITPLLLMLGLTANNGLLGWVMEEVHLSDKSVHFVMALFVTILLGWLLGSRSLWRGLAGIAVGAALGVVGEVLQMWSPARGVERADAIAHALGSGVALFLYLLCMGARASESVDARGPVRSSGAYRVKH